LALDTFFQHISDLPFATAIREGETLFPTIECIHVVAITLVVGTIGVVDLRLLGLASRRRAVTRLTGEVLPVTWTAFVTAAITGSLLFCSNATKYIHNPFFLSKMCLMVVAFLNMVVFHFITSKDIQRWDESPRTPPAAKLAGAMSLLVWLAVIVTGRWIGFTLSAF
jgi:hypothetical protein